MSQRRGLLCIHVPPLFPLFTHYLHLWTEYSGHRVHVSLTDERNWLVNIYRLLATGSRLQRQGRRRRMSGSSCWCTPTNTLPLIIFIIYMPGAVWCTVTDYHNNDGARWMATRRKACFIIGMKPACTRSLQKRRRAFMLDLAQLQTQHDQQCQQTDAVTRI